MGLTRLELYKELGIEFSIVEPILIAAYEREAHQEWRHGRGRPPTSFYISSFPGDDPHACGRAAVYSLMDLPEEKPIAPRLQSIFDAGKNHELEWTRRFAASGVLLSGDETAGEEQTRFADPNVWASGACDAIILPYRWTKPHIVEIKTTAAEKVQAMRDNRESTPYSHDKYVRQIKTYIGLAHELPFAPEVTVCEASWAITKEMMGARWCPFHQGFDCTLRTIQLDPPEDGTLIYSSRDEPLDIVSYHFSLDLDFLAAGRAKLAEWRSCYERGVLPPHPLESQRAKWSVHPCRFCKYKGSGKLDGCKADYTAGITNIAESHWIKSAGSIRDNYSYPAVRAAVLARWGVNDPLREEVAA
jgi:hypothetical protein